jgi:hypothetical protein
MMWLQVPPGALLVTSFDRVAHRGFLGQPAYVSER